MKRDFTALPVSVGCAASSTNFPVMGASAVASKTTGSSSCLPGSVSARSFTPEGRSAALYCKSPAKFARLADIMVAKRLPRGTVMNCRACDSLRATCGMLITTRASCGTISTR